jgi:hypothetical protein
VQGCGEFFPGTRLGGTYITPTLINVTLDPASDPDDSGDAGSADLPMDGADSACASVCHQVSECSAPLPDVGKRCRMFCFALSFCSFDAGDDSACVPLQSGFAGFDVACWCATPAAHPARV